MSVVNVYRAQVTMDECEAIIAEFMDLDDDSNDSEQLSSGQFSILPSISESGNRSYDVWI